MAKTIFRCLVRLLLLAVSRSGQRAERVLKVGVIHHSPPMSYVDASGGLTGFNVEIMRELCKEMAARCETVAHRPGGRRPGPQVRSTYAAVSLLVTPERGANCCCSPSPYYRSISVWFAGPASSPAGRARAVVKGGIRARYAQARGWVRSPSTTTRRSSALAAGQASRSCCRWQTPRAAAGPRMSAQGLASTVVQDPELAGDAALGSILDRALLDKKLNGCHRP